MSESPLMSMTGFGSATRESGSWRINVQARSVNHRNLDLVLRLPELARSLEPKVRAMVRSMFWRGHIEVGVDLVSTATSGDGVRVDHAVADRLLVEARRLSESGDGIAMASAGEILALPGVVSLAPTEASWSASEDSLVEEAVSDALLSLRAARQREGEDLEDLLNSFLEDLRSELLAVAELQETVRSELQLGLRRRMEELLAEIPVDEIRLAQEAALLVERCDVAEEVARLSTHIDRGGELLAGDPPRGRKLDFLMQEVQREFNTLGAKNRNPEVARMVLSGRALCEQMREQVQNVE